MTAGEMGSDYLRDTRIVVIGGGVVGAAASYRLAQAGARVTTIEKRFPGGGTSSSSFAWLNGFSKAPRHYNRLNVLSIRDHQDLADELEGDWVHIDGGLHWERADEPAKLANQQTAVRRLREWGVRLDITTPEIVMRELEPDLNIDREMVGEVIVVPREGWLNAVTMAHAVLQGARRRYGAELIQAEVVGLKGPSGAVDSVVLDNGDVLTADIVVNAAGPAAAAVAGLAGVKLPIDRQLGMVVSTSAVPVRLRHVVYCGDARIRPEGGPRYVIHPEYLDSIAVEDQPVAASHPLVQRGLEETARTLPGLAQGTIESVRVGVRPMPVDGLPVVGFDPRVSGLYHLVTHSGVTLSARLSVLMTEELCGGDVAELAPYRPDRFVE